MVKVTATAGGITTTKALRPNVLTVPAVPLGHGCRVAGIDKNYLTVLILTVGTVSLIVAVVVAGNIGMSAGHKSFKRTLKGS